MSSHVIRNFINTFNNVTIAGCKVKNVNRIPYPKYPINTDKLITGYQKTLDIYVREGKIKNPEDYTFKKIKVPFPKEYFNYESV